MNVLYTNIAELNIKITHRYGYIARLCERYLSCSDGEISDADIDIDASVTEEDMAREAGLIEVPEGRELHPAHVESMALCRKIAEELPKFGCFLMHGSAVSVDGKAYIFTAPSGTGKSTHASLWRKVFGDRAVMVNDDKPFIRLTGDGIFVCGTPWNGKHGLGDNICVPLKAVCLLKRDTVNHIERITSASAFPRLMMQTYRPADPEMLSLTLGMLDRVSKETELYELGCNMDPEAATVAYEGMNR